MSELQGPKNYLYEMRKRVGSMVERAVSGWMYAPEIQQKTAEVRERQNLFKRGEATECDQRNGTESMITAVGS